jgi:hypothetical protein
MSTNLKSVFNSLPLGVLALGLNWGTALPVFADAADSTPPGTQWTPDGTATLVQPDDPALVTPTPAPAPPAISRPDPSVVQELAQLSDQCLTLLSERNPASPTQYYEKGDWHFTNEILSCDAGPGGLAAALWKYRQSHPDTMDAAAKARQSWLYQAAVDTMERGISLHGPDGRLANPGTHDVFWYIEFANTYLLLKDTLSPETRQRWLDTMAREVTALEKSGDLPNPALANGVNPPSWKATDGWYTNGNVDLCHAAWIYLVWQATGDQKYKDLFETCWRHTLLPSQLRWKGYGLYFLKAPTKADGSDGSGYITEAQGAPGFDKEYGMLQFSILGRLYLHSRDPRVLRVTNVLCNGLLPHLNKDTMILNCLYGSRHSTLAPFATSAVPVLAWLGGRDDLTALLPDQLAKGLPPVYLENITKKENNPFAYRGYGFDMETELEAAMAAEK